MAAPRINSQRLNDSLATLGRIGETPDGMMRLAFSLADVEARRYVTGLMTAAGLSVRLDTAANIIARREGSEPSLPAIALGSHTDTVPNGGKYDGALGVLGAIECLQTLEDLSIITRHPVEILDFTNEEGTRYSRWLYGSRAMAGLHEADDLTAVDAEGVPVGDRLRDVGGDIQRIAQAQRRSEEFAAYLELHIEQGPVLQSTGVPIGTVTAITGRVALEVTLRGFANHAGTTPMSARRDALLAASRVVQAVNSIATDEEVCRVGTVGIVRVSPGADNVIPGRAELAVEFRDESMGRLDDAERRLRQICQEISTASNVEIDVAQLGVTDSSPMSAGIQEIVAKAAQDHGFETSSLPSGAGHDAQSMAVLCQAGMIFVPSVDGISHSPNEYSTPEACANGADVLLQTLLTIDRQFDK